MLLNLILILLGVFFLFAIVCFGIQWGTLIVSIHILIKKMLLSFGYIEGLFNGQYILLANKGDLNFIYLFFWVKQPSLKC